jgi:hypothetical protein
MIVLDKTVISDDVAENFFVCNIEKCKGACCVEGDMGAPLEEEEVSIIEDIYETVKPYLSEEGIKAIEEQGTWVIDEDGDFSTPTIGNRECAYAVYDDNKTLHCGIERAYYDGKTDWKKPISCHLYPIRITKYEEYDALNYDRWSICSDACSLGSTLGIPVYKFLKEPLIRKYGEDWYTRLADLIESTAKKK